MLGSHKKDKARFIVTTQLASSPPAHPHLSAKACVTQTQCELSRGGGEAGKDHLEREGEVKRGGNRRGEIEESAEQLRMHYTWMILSNKYYK